MRTEQRPRGGRLSILLVTGLVFACSGPPSVTWSKDDCSVSGGELRWTHGGSSTPLTFAACSVMYATFEDPSDMLRIALIAPGEEGSLAFPGRGWINVVAGLPKDYEDSSFSFAANASYDDAAIALSLPARSVYARLVSPEDGSQHDYRGRVVGSDFNVEAAEASGEGYGKLNLTLKFAPGNFVATASGETSTLDGTLTITGVKAEPVGGGSGACPVGTWDAPPGCNGLTNTLHLSGSSDGGTGKYEIADCNGICTKSSTYTLVDWTATAGTLSLDWGTGLTCGKVNNTMANEPNLTGAYACDGNTLTYQGLSWTKR